MGPLSTLARPYSGAAMPPTTLATSSSRLGRVASASTWAACRTAALQVAALDAESSSSHG